MPALPHPINIYLTVPPARPFAAPIPPARKHSQSPLLVNRSPLPRQNAGCSPARAADCFCATAPLFVIDPSLRSAQTDALGKSRERQDSSASAVHNTCPACGTPLLPGAIACMDCGFLIASTEPGTVEGDGPGLILCSNPACGVANPPGERNCVRCSTPLPTAHGTMLQGRYKIDRLLAMGGFGAVYLAIDVKNADRPVAIKDMICSDPQEFAIRLNFFRREYEILKALEKLTIVPRVYELIELKRLSPSGDGVYPWSGSAQAHGGE